MNIDDFLKPEHDVGKAKWQSKKLEVMSPELVKITPLKTLKKIYPDLPENYIRKIQAGYQK